MARQGRAIPARRRQARLSANLQYVLPALGALIGFLLIIGPFLCGLARSLLVWHGDAVRLSIAHFSGLLSDVRFYDAVGNTLFCGVCTTAISAMLGISLAWIVARTNVPGKSVFETLNLVPFFMSPYVGAIAWTFLVAPDSGLLQNFLKDTFHVSADRLNIYSRGGVIWVLSLFYTPYVYLLVISPLRQMDGARNDAARVHGASFWMTVRAITLPLMEPAILSAALIVFITSTGLFDVPLALTATKGIRMVPTEIFSLVNYPSDLGRASAYGIVIVTATIGLTLLQRRHQPTPAHDRDRKGYRARPLELTWRGKTVALAIECTYIATAVTPVLVLIGSGFRRCGPVASTSPRRHWRTFIMCCSNTP